MSEKKIAAYSQTSPLSTDQSGLSAPLKLSTSPRPMEAGGTPLDLMLKIGLVVLAMITGFFVYRAVSLNSQLTQTRGEVGQQQTQADQLRGELAKAEAADRESAAQAAKLQSQVQQATAETVVAKMGAEKASAEMAQLRQQLEKFKTEAASAKANAEKASAEVVELHAKLRAQAEAAAAETAVKPAVPSLKQLSLDVSFKKAMMLDRNALVIQNTSTAVFSPTVRFSNQTSSKEFQVELQPGAVKEMGWLGAWVLASGDQVEIKCDGYETIAKIAP